MATTKELHRNSFRGFLKQFWNPNPKVAEQPNRIVLSRSNSPGANTTIFWLEVST